mmetsp:Transcript_47033/g.106530  ORF Transcript_47033/g.106530 Transcript_47033/m.106530 type:complete len:339 (-) Transcript_47033:392-1408(-)
MLARRRRPFGVLSVGGRPAAAAAAAATAPPKAGVQEGRVPENQELLAPRRGVLGDEREPRPPAERAQGHQLLQVLERVLNRRAAVDKLQRPRVAVEGAEAHEPPQDGRHVRPEDAPVAVRLVHHHEAEVRQDPPPLAVVGQQRDVQHVRVGQNQVRLLPRPAPLRVGRVPVDDGGPRPPAEGRRPPAEQRVEGAELVLRERLGREEVQRDALGGLEDGLQDGHVEADALPRRGARAQGHVPPLGAQGRLHRGGLVGEEAADAPRTKRGLDRRGHHALPPPRARREDKVAKLHKGARPRGLRAGVLGLPLVEGELLERVEHGVRVHVARGSRRRSQRRR